jgi:hypothetical protein
MRSRVKFALTAFLAAKRRYFNFSSVPKRDTYSPQICGKSLTNLFETNNLVDFTHLGRR